MGERGEEAFSLSLLILGLSIPVRKGKNTQCLVSRPSHLIVMHACAQQYFTIMLPATLSQYLRLFHVPIIELERTKSPYNLKTIKSSMEQSLFEKLTVAQLVKKFTAFIKPES